jgi:hypothetical protein
VNVYSKKNNEPKGTVLASTPQLSGEAGIGKSAALLEAVGSHTRLRNLCPPQHTDNVLYL